MSPERELLTPAALGRRLRALDCRRACWLAYSGGLDSTVLLHLLVALRELRLLDELHAVHVHHGLSSRADAWAEHCRLQCRALGVPLRVLEVQVDRDLGTGLEAAARDARYRALAGALPVDASLLLAHHQDDQAETVLLRLLRGAGPAGLGAMQASAERQGLHLLRPLLDVSRAGLERYAAEHRLQWVDDDSNADLALDRNYLRHEVLPRLRSRWPQLGPALAESARLCADTDALLARRLDAELGEWRGCARLPLAWLAAQVEDAQEPLLRHWLLSLGLAPVGRRFLTTIRRELIGAEADACPRLAWRGAELRRYDGWLHVLRLAPEAPAPGPYCWQGEPWLELPANGWLEAQTVTAEGVRADRLQAARVEVLYRRGGERLQPAGRVGTHPLKKLFQEHRVPPWLRDRLPLLRVDGAWVAAVGLFVCEGWQASPAQPGIRFSWHWSAEIDHAATVRGQTR